jgi:8-oxo-dGTP pyrophosphatase MutT (NUDIX family)
LLETSLQRVRQALALAEFDVTRAHRLLAPIPRTMWRPPERTGAPRQGAVLLLLYPADSGLNLVLIRRPHDLAAHAGQIAFPGGQREPGESLYKTALRETEEEVGIRPTAVERLGELSTIYISVSDFEVHPFVGWHATAPVFYPNRSEVAEILESPLTTLLDPAAQVSETWQLRGVDVEVPFYQLGRHKVWGATAIILSEFIERLRAIKA